MTDTHARILQYPFMASLQGALLDSFQEGQSSLILNVRALESTSSELFERDGKVHERLHGAYRPTQLRFHGVSGIQGVEWLRTLSTLAADDPARMVNDVLAWSQSDRQDAFFLFFLHQAENLMFFADQVEHEILLQDSTPFTLERDWCSPPPMPGRLVPQPRELHQRFGGDPITIHLEARPFHERLFIGGTEVQPEERPQVDVVFNVGENPSRWVKENQVSPPDRWDNKGEGAEGMSLGVIREEASWVIEHLKQNRRVLVHCAAGMNRSSTICCAALILLEGLTAEQALERVRENHPWARPDSGHWLRLRWLAKANIRSGEDDKL